MSKTSPQFRSGAWAYLARISLVIARTFVKPLGFDSRISACFFQRREDLFGGDVADQIVSGKWTAAESGERAVEAAASRFVGRQDFLFGIFRAAVQVHAEFDSRDVILHLAVEIADEFRRRRFRRCRRARRCAREYPSAIPAFRARFPAPKAHHTGSRRPWRCKLRGRGSLPRSSFFSFSTSLRDSSRLMLALARRK